MDITYGIRTEDCKYGRRGIYPKTNTAAIASIPGNISCIIQDLMSANVEEDKLREVLHEIEQRELFGHELIPQLRLLLRKHGRKWHNGDAQLQCLMQIEHLLKQTR